MKPTTLITDDMPPEFGGMFECLWTVKIRPKYQNDEGLIAHEMEHWKQCYRSLFIFHALLYTFHMPYRQWAEVQAYRVQLSFCTDDNRERALSLFSGWISTEYRLNISQDDALKLLTE